MRIGGRPSVQMHPYSVGNAIQDLQGNKQELLRPLAEVLNLSSASGTSVHTLGLALATYSWPDVSGAVHVLCEGHFLAAGFQKKYPNNDGNAAKRQTSKDANRKAGEALREQWAAFISDRDEPMGDAAGGETDSLASLDEWDPAAPPAPRSRLNVFSARTHLMLAVHGSQGTIMLAVNKDALSGSMRMTAAIDGTLLFYFYDTCPLCRNRPNLATQIQKIWDKEPGHVSGGQQAVFPLSGCLPVFGGDGVVERDDQRRPVMSPLRDDRSFFSWDAVAATVRAGGVLEGQPGFMADAKLREGVNTMGVSLINLVLHTKPSALLASLAAGDAPFEGTFDVTLGDDGALVPEVGGGAAAGGGLAGGRGAGGGRRVAAAASARQRLTGLEERQEVLHSFHSDLHLFFCQEKVGLMYALNTLYKSMLKKEEDAVLATLRGAGCFSEAEIAAFGIPPGMLVLPTDEHIGESARLWDARTGRVRDRRCIPLELVTSLELGPPSNAELDVGDGDVVRYSQERKNLYRSKVDRLMQMHSRQFFTGLDRPLRALAHACGAPHSILDLFRALHGIVASKRMNKIMRSKHAEAAHVLNVAYLLASVIAGMLGMLAWDNFIRNIKIGKNVGGAYGSYLIHHFCHMCCKRVFRCAPEHGDGKVPPRGSPDAQCWLCLGNPPPAHAAAATTAKAAGLCGICAARPHVPIGEAEFAFLKAQLLNSTQVTDGKLNPFMHSDELGRAHLKEDNLLGALLLTVAAAAGQGFFGATEALMQIWAANRRAMLEEQTYPLEHVESIGHTDGSRVIALGMKSTNSTLGLLGFQRLITTHGLLGPFLDESFSPILADSKIYWITERPHYMTGIERGLLYNVMPRGLRGCNILDSGLHVVGKYSEHVFLHYRAVLNLLFRALVGPTGEGNLPPPGKAPKLSVRMTVISLIFSSYDAALRECLITAVALAPGDPAVSALLALLEQHVPLVIYYAQCFRLGRSTDIETRRAAFDMWIGKLLGLVIIQIDHLGSTEYGKTLLQWACKVLWYKENWPWMWHTLRDNFALILDGEFIELIHSWVSNNFTRLDFSKTDFEQVVEAFMRKDWLQRAKAGLQESGGCAPEPVPRHTRDFRAMEGDRERVRGELDRIVRAVSKEAHRLAKSGQARKKVVTAKGNKSQESWSQHLGPVSLQMVPFGGDVGVRLDEIKKAATAELLRSPATLGAAVINEFCANADLRVKGTTVDELAKHFGGFQGAHEEEAPEAGTTRALHRQTAPGGLSGAARFSVTNILIPKLLLFGSETEKDASLVAIVNGIVGMLPGGDAAMRELSECGQLLDVDWDEGAEGRVLGTRKMRSASIVLRQVGDSKRRVISFNVERGAASTTQSFALARAAEGDVRMGDSEEEGEGEGACGGVVEEEEAESLVCGELEIGPGVGGGQDMIMRLHARIETVMRNGAIRCLKLIGAGMSEEATTLAARLADLRFGGATDVVDYASNYALFTIIAACAQAATAMFYRANEGAEGDMHLILDLLNESRLNILEAVTTNRPDNQPAVEKGKAAPNKLMESMKAMLHVIDAVWEQCDQARQQAEARGEGDDGEEEENSA